jgi:hypothetical protein
LDDSYLGSGKRLSRSVKKHGRENHKREIIESFNDRLSLIAREKEIITSELIKNPLCMNLILGGAALHRPATSEETRAKLSKAGKGRLHTELHKARMSAALKGRKHSPEEIENHRKAMIGFKWSEEALANRKAGQRQSKKFQEHLSKIKRAVIIHDIEYQDVRSASIALGISSSTLEKRCSSKSLSFTNFRYKDNS